MAIQLRPCAGPVDFPAISDFLYSLYLPDNGDGNWFQPIWEYAYTHPWFDEQSVQRIGIWEESGAIVAVTLYELRPGEAFFQVHPAYIPPTARLWRLAVYGSNRSTSSAM